MKNQTTIVETAVSPLVYLMKNYADYNLWANATLVNWLRTKPADVLAREVPSSFSSIRSTILHIWQTQRYWLSIIKRTEPEILGTFEGTLEDAFTCLVESSDEFFEYVNEITEENLLENNLVVSPWFQCDFQNFEYVMQCLNHSTYHRGQIVTIGRNLGFTDAPMTDYNFYNIHGK